MGTTVDGADIGIYADLGGAPFVLNRDHLNDPGSVLTPAEDSLNALECEVLAASWTWGATEWRGPLTAVEVGRATLVLFDPARAYDPANAAATWKLTPGALVQVQVDAQPAWTGSLIDVTHSLSTGQTVIVAEDDVAVLSRVVDGAGLAAGTTAAQFLQAVTRAGRGADRSIVYGAPAAYRLAATGADSVWLTLLLIARAELGDLWIDHRGRVAFRGRGVGADGGGAELGCDGADLEDLVSQLTRRAIVNHVLVESAPGVGGVRTSREWEDANSRSLYGRRSLQGLEDELLLGLAP